MILSTDLYTDLFEIQLSTVEKLRSEKIEERQKRLLKLRDWILHQRRQIQDALYADFKKPPPETEITEIFVVLNELQHTLKNLRKWTKPQKVKTPLTFLGTRSWVQFEPKGICLIISPWNFPFNLAIGPLVSALAAGNTAIIKPSEFTPHTSALIQQLVEDLFSKDEVAVVQGDASVSRELLKLPLDRHIEATQRHIETSTLRRRNAH